MGAVGGVGPGHILGHEVAPFVHAGIVLEGGLVRILQVAFLGCLNRLNGLIYCCLRLPRQEMCATFPNRGERDARPPANF